MCRPPTAPGTARGRSGLGWSSESRDSLSDSCRPPRARRSSTYESAASPPRLPGRRRGRRGRREFRCAWHSNSGIDRIHATAQHPAVRPRTRRRFHRSVLSQVPPNPHEGPPVIRLSHTLRAAAVLGLPAALAAQNPKTQPVTHKPEPTSATITAADLKTRLYIYAADSMEGRETGTRGHIKATNYIAAQLKALGLKPMGDNGT